MKRVEVSLGDRTYPILVGSGTLGRTAQLALERYTPTSVAVITHLKLQARYGHLVRESFANAGVPVHEITIPPGERYKTLRTVERLSRELVRAGVDRRGLIVALGGGVLGDISGFVAASYLRGISYVQAPTTVLAQVDASVGGKTGVDLPEGKNLVGAFHQPLAVVIDTDTLATLPLRELRSGIAEVVKYGIIADERLYSVLESSIPALLNRSPSVLEDVIVRSCEIKADVVAADETEQGLRAILNFGHTIGHALETVTQFRRYRHGEAISIGMVSACLIGEEAGVTSTEVTNSVRSLLDRLRLPTIFPADVDADETIQATFHDKKRVGGSVTYILAERIGRVQMSQKVSTEMVRAALKRQCA